MKLTKEVVEKISSIKGEPKWMLDFRLRSLDAFLKSNNPNFGPKLDIDYDNITYYKERENNLTDNWNNISCDVRNIFDDLGVISAEAKYLDGMGAQYDSEVIYHNMNEELKKKNVIFMDTDSALREYPELFKKYFNTLVKYNENKFTALNGAVWSGGTFIYIPPNTELDRPLQSYFRINSKNMGQFERTLIIVDDNSSVHYMEGCTAPTYTEDSLHAAVVEIFVGKNSKCRYSTVQNWSTDVYNLKGDYAKGTCISVAAAGSGQIQDSGAKMIHLGKYTKSNIISKSIASGGGNATYRGTVKITKNAIGSKASVKCDTLILDDKSKSDTIPTNIVNNNSSFIEHEATVSKISEDKLFYLMSRGLDEDKAKELIIMGFISAFREELPTEYAVELNRLLAINIGDK